MYVLSNKRKRKYTPYDRISQRKRSRKTKKYRKHQRYHKEYSYSDDSDSSSDEEQLDLYGQKQVYSHDNHIYFKTDVSDASVTSLINIINKKEDEYEAIQSLKMVKSIVPNPLILHITSRGGTLFDGYRAMDKIKNCKIPIHTVVDGYAASCGSLMAVVGKKRFMTQNSNILMHQLSGSSDGKYEEMRDDFINNKALMKNIIRIYDENTKMNPDDIKKYLKHDKWWGYDRCLDLGLIDDVWTN